MNSRHFFIGRENELQMIDDMIFDPSGSNNIWPIIGQAGVGKTWLLRQILQHYRNDPRVIVITIDHSQLKGHNMPELAIDLFKQFTSYMSPENLNELFRHLSLAEFTSTSLDFNNMSDDQAESFLFRLQLLLKLTGRKRIVILNDALDARVATDMTDRYMMMFGSSFRNVVMVSAGRPTDNVMSVYDNHATFYKFWEQHPIYKLEPFSLYESNEYFYKILPSAIGTDLPTKTFLLTEGHPVLIGIAGEWLKRHINLPEEIDLPLIKLQFMDKEGLIKLRQRFEYALTDKIRSLRETIDVATLYLTFLNLRYDPKILQLALGIENRAALKTIISELKNSVFVRQFISSQNTLLLHEEAQRLLREYVWPAVDRDKQKRRALAQKVIDGYYLPEIKRLRKTVQSKLMRAIEQRLIRADESPLPPKPDEVWLKHELELECLDYYFRVSPEAGWTYFDQLLGEALIYHSSNLQIDGIMHAVQQLAPPEQINSVPFQVRQTQALLHKEKFEEATVLAQQALQSTHITPADAAVALVVLGKSTADPVMKLTCFQNALQQANNADNKGLQAKVYFELGFAYQLQGRWQEAITEYERVLRLLDFEKEEAQYAVTLDNLAFVTMLSGNPMQADNIAEKALRIRKKQGNVHGISLSYATKGHIAHALGDYIWAARSHRTAVDLAKSVGDQDNIALFQCYVASDERRFYRFKEARELLEAGLESNQSYIRAQALYQAAQIEIDEAQLLQRQRGSRKKIKRFYDAAESKVTEALAISQKIRDNYLIASILYDGAILYYFREKKAHEEYIEALQQLLDEHDYPLKKGRLIELLGDLAHLKGDVISAFTHYLHACEILAHYSQATFRHTFVRVRSSFFEATPEQQAEISHMIAAKFPHVDATSPLNALKGLSWSGI